MSTLHLVKAAGEGPEILDSGRFAGFVSQAADNAASHDLVCLSRFMTAVSSTLDPEGVCAAAARELYDLSPYRQIAFRLDLPTGPQIISFCPGIRQDTWTDDGKDGVKLVSSLAEVSDWHERRQIMPLPDG